MDVLYTTFLLFLVPVYILPTVIALLRVHPNPGPLIVINLLLGWTLIGWVMALALAFYRPQTQPEISTGYEAGPNASRTADWSAAIPPPPPPPPPGTALTDGEVRDRLKRLERLQAEGLLTDDEYAAKRRDVLDGI